MRQDLQFGMLLMVVGMGLVFLILTMLWGAIAIFQQIDRRALAREEKKAHLSPKTEARTDASIPPDLMAAIMLALHHYREVESLCNVSSLKKHLPTEIEPGQARWVAVGRAYQLRSNIIPRRRRTS
jgi:sodium pump decarboxylase gamma subunit